MTTKRIDVESFLDNRIPNMTERLLMWQYNLDCYMGLWEAVLKDKARLAEFYQTGE